MDKITGISEKRNLLTTTTQGILLIVLVALLSGCSKGYYKYPPLWAEVNVKPSGEYKVMNLTNSNISENNTRINLNGLWYYFLKGKYYNPEYTNEHLYYLNRGEFDSNLGLSLDLLFENYDKYIYEYNNVLTKIRNKYTISSITIEQNSCDLTIIDSSGFYNDEIDPSKDILLHAHNINALEFLPIFYLPPKDFINFIDPSKIPTRYSAEIASYEEKAKRESYYYITFDNSLIRYNVTLDKPFIRSNSPQSKSNIKLTIMSKDFDVRLPPYIERDDNIIVIFTGKYLNFINISNVYLRIHEASLYYNNKISPIQFKPFELPPKSTFEDPISIEKTNIRNDIFTDAIWNDMTAKKAKETEVSFGFAVKYERHEASIAVLKTFFQIDKYSLYNILDDKGQGSYKELWDKNKDEFDNFDIPSELKPQVTM